MRMRIIDFAISEVGVKAECKCLRTGQADTGARDEENTGISGFSGYEHLVPARTTGRQCDKIESSSVTRRAVNLGGCLDHGVRSMAAGGRPGGALFKPVLLTMSDLLHNELGKYIRNLIPRMAERPHICQEQPTACATPDVLAGTAPVANRLAQRKVKLTVAGPRSAPRRSPTAAPCWPKLGVPGAVPTPHQPGCLKTHRGGGLTMLGGTSVRLRGITGQGGRDSKPVWLGSYTAVGPRPTQNFRLGAAAWLSRPRT
jgi:hypothetical protein